MEVGGDPSPESIDRELARVERNKRRTRIIFAASALLAIVGVVVLQLARTYQAKRVLRTAWDEAAGCLFGGPLDPDERASLRFRRIKLAVDETEKLKRRYPERCIAPLATLHHTLIKQDKKSELAKHVHKLKAELEQGHGLKNLSYVIDQLAESARASELSVDDIPRPDDDAPPEPIVTWDITTVGSAARLTDAPLGAHAVSSDKWPGAVLNLLLHDPKADVPPVLCRFDDGGPDASCRELGGAAARGKELRLAGTADRRAAPLLFGRALSQDVVFRSDTGEEITRGAIQTAFVAEDGYVAMTTAPLDDDIGTFELLEQTRGEPVRRLGFGPDDFGATTITNWAVAYGQLVIQTVVVDDDLPEDEDPELPKMRARSLPVLAAGKAELTEVGALDWVNAPLSFCASQEALAMKVGTRAGYLTFFDGRGWSMPSRHERLGNVVGCRGTSVLLHDFGPIRACDAKACKDAGLMDASFGDFSHVRARRTVLGDKLLAVAESEERRGLRYVHGDGEVSMLFDDLVRQGEVQVNSTVSGTRIFSREGFAVALLFTEEGVVAIYFGPDGRAQPAKVSRK